MRLLALFLLSGLSILGADIIPAARRTDSWSYAGVSGGIPTVTTIFTNMPAGSTRAAVQNSLELCPSNQVVKLAAGAYSWADTLDWEDVGDGVVLRGAGMGSTIITWSTFSTQGIIFRRHLVESSFDVDADLTADTLKGSTTLTLASVPSWVTVGNLIGIDELDDPALSNEDGDNQRVVDFNGDPRANGARNLSQIVRVTAKDATTITIEVPAVWDWTTGQTAQIYQPGYNPSTQIPLRRCAMEDMTLSYSFTGGNDAHPIVVYPSDNCWFKNIEIDNMPAGRGWLVYYSYRCEWRGVYVHDSHNYLGGQGYGLDFNGNTTSCLIEDSIFSNLHVSFTVRYGSMGNVCAHNYIRDGVNASAQTGGVSHHGCHSAMNLFEGNLTEPKVLVDWTHGSSSHSTVHRNRIHGVRYAGSGSGDMTAISNEYFSRYWNFVGNVVGVTGRHNKLVAHSGSTAAGSQGTIYKMGGVININNDYTTSDTFSHTNGMFVLIHANGDSVTSTNGGITFNLPPGQTISDTNLTDSYFLSGRPAWYPSAFTWPPFTPGTSTYSTNQSVVELELPAAWRYFNPGEDYPVAGSAAVSISDVTIGGVKLQ